MTHPAFSKKSIYTRLAFPQKEVPQAPSDKSSHTGESKSLGDSLMRFEKYASDTAVWNECWASPAPTSSSLDRCQRHDTPDQICCLNIAGRSVSYRLAEPLVKHFIAIFGIESALKNFWEKVHDCWSLKKGFFNWEFIFTFQPDVISHRSDKIQLMLLFFPNWNVSSRVFLFIYSFCWNYLISLELLNCVQTNK